MSSTKRKRSMPQQLSEEKRSKMTWSMRDQMSDNQDDYLWEPLDGKTGSVTSVCRDRTCRPLKKGRKKENQGCVELNLDNSYPTKWHCTLGSFNIFLSTSKRHVQSLGERVDMVACSSVSSEISTTCGTNGEILVPSDSSASEPCSSATEDSTDVDVVVTLNLETQCSLESMDFDNLNYVKERDYLKGLKLKAFVPCVTKEQLNALVYLQSKGIISLVLSPEQPVLTDCWLVAVCLNECGLTKLSFPSVEMRMRKADKMIIVLMTWFFSSFKEYSQSQELEVPVVHVDKGFGDVYDAVKTIQQNSCPSAMQVPATNLSPSPSENSLSTDKGDDFISKVHVPSSCSTTELCSSDGIKEHDDVQHPRLKPALRSYQKRAVRWMMNREKHQNSIPQEQEYSGKLNNTIHPLWKEVYTLDGQVIYYNPYTGRLTRERFSSPALPRGGILADEMGLGKTVEVIACILNHPKPSSDFNTADEHSTVDSRTTTAYNQKLISCCSKQSKSSVEVTGSIQECATSEPNMCEQGRTIKCICQSTCTPKNEADVIDMEVIAGQTSPVGEAPLKSSHTLPDVSISNDKERATQMVSDLLHSRTADHAGESHSRTSDHTGESHSRTSDLTGESHSRTPDHTGESHSRTSDLTSESHASEEGNASSVLKCQCICGSNDTNLSDSLLRCCSCQAVFHAKCLQHESTEEFVCPHCIVNRPAVSSRVTLIISPAPIAQQWVEEISRHTETSALRLLVYEGVAKMGFIQPAVLADHDVILTTYSTLRADFYHLGAKQADGAGRSLRYDKRYVALPSPLTAVFFWRICLDEAQMVESATAKAAEVALHLKCEHRWCVTGTPLQRGLEDIYGLLLFLGVYPYCQRSWWKTLLYEPYKNGRRQPLYNLLARIMWRSAKNDVINEIQLPKQEEKVKWLTFSPVEHHFYCRQHEECARTTLKMLSHWEKSDTKLSTIDRHTVHQMVTPLLRLRQACCHPQAVRGGFLSMQKSTLTMEQLLESLTTKAKLECEEAHRQLLFAFNGLAGIHIIKEEWPNAVDLYREAMRSWTEHQHTFRTDALQKLHTLCNLSAVLSNAYPGCSRTLRDDNLQNEVKDMKQVYMTRVNTQVAVAQQNLDVVKTSITETLQKVDLQSPWWMSALQSVMTGSMDGDLLQRVKDELSSTEMDLASFGQRFSDVRGLQYLISSKLDTIMSTHDNLLVSLEELNVEPSSQMVQVSAECCLRPAKDHSHATRCKFCEVDDIFTEYESRLFGHQGMKGVTEQDMQPDERLDWHRHGNTGGLRAESEVEKVLKVLFNFIKAQKIIPSVHQEARYHLNMIEALRKEFKFLRALWFALHERVSSLDELDMCTTRLRLLLPGEPLTDDIHVIHPLQVEQQRLKFLSDRVVAQTELRKKLGQLLYLNNLAKTQTCRDGKNPDPCPVCTKQLGVQWSVFSCGHCICCQCAWVLLRQAGIGPRQRDVQVKCPMCRLPTVAREISYVSTARNQTDKPEDNVVVKGSHSTKVEAVVRTVLSIRMSDSTAKCLVFSTWQDVLGVVGRALDENGINYRHIAGSRHFQTNLQTFKQDPDVCVLLLPLHSGSNGLNIIEATHVLLVEPALNPAHELQAVGRVHRIGQTKPTHVYRFIIRGTVESRMFALLQSKPTTCVRPGAHDNENASLTVGDLAALFTADCEEEEQCTGSFHLQEEPEQLPSR